MSYQVRVQNTLQSLRRANMDDMDPLSSPESVSDAPVVFFSHASGNTKRFVDALRVPRTQRIDVRYGRGLEGCGPVRMTAPYVLVIPTYKSERNTFVPESVKRFLRDFDNSKFMIGVIGTGSRNFGTEFCRAAELVSKRFGVPVVGEVEFSGMPDEHEALSADILDLTMRDIRRVDQEGEVHVGQ